MRVRGALVRGRGSLGPAAGALPWARSTFSVHPHGWEHPSVSVGAGARQGARDPTQRSQGKAGGAGWWEARGLRGCRGAWVSQVAAPLTQPLSSPMPQEPARAPRASAASQVMGLGWGKGGGHGAGEGVCPPCVEPGEEAPGTLLGHPCAISPGTLPAPVLSLSTSSTREGELVLLRCFVNWKSDATRVVFCKDGMEKYSLRAARGQLMYVMELNVTLESAGWYTCGYQHKDEKNWVRSSALSVPRHVAITGETRCWEMGRHHHGTPDMPVEGGGGAVIPYGVSAGAWDA